MDTLCLEFANTLRWHASPQPEETLRSYAALVEWAQRAGLVSDRDARRLLRHAADHPAEAGRALKRAIVLREAVYRIFVALAHRHTPADADLAELNDRLVKSTSGARIVGTPQGFAWDWPMDPDALDSFIGRIALSAAALLVSDERGHVGQCADERGCGWLFLDTSKNHSRRWCDIADCGNRAKQRRHYRRMRERRKAVRPSGDV